MNERAFPTITVITVTLNDIVGLRNTLNSVAIQTDCKLEHWIIDGGSEDGSLEVLRDYASHSKDAHYVSEPDSGIFDAMNRGIRSATGEVLVFLNSGDSFTDSGVLSFVSNEWVTGEWEWGYGAIRHTTASGAACAGTVQSPFRKRRFQLGFRFVPWPSTYISRELMERLGGFDEEFGYAADQELAMRAASLIEPVTWVRFMADFLVGGISSGGNVYKREQLWHRMRVRNGVPFLRSRVADFVFSCFVALYRGSRQRAGNLSRDSRWSRSLK